MIEFHDVKLGYVKEYYALYNINLKIEDKAKFALIGGKGDGKTTFLRVIAKLEKISSGDVLYNGVPIENLDYSKDLSVAYLATQPVLMSGSVRNNIDYVLKIRKKPKEERCKIIDETLEKFNLKEIQHEKTKKMTLYQKRLLQFAMLSVRPKIDILLVDDILQCLNDVEQNNLKEILKRFMNNATTIFVSSDEHQARELCDVVGYIKLGAISGIKNNVEEI